VYIDMAQEFIQIANEKLGKTCLEINARELDTITSPLLGEK